MALEQTIEADLSISPATDGVHIRCIFDNSTLEFVHSFHDLGFFYKRVTTTNQGLLKACNNKQRSIRSLLDLTGGWGLDSFILAQHGKQVTTLEQNKHLYSVILQSLNNARLHSHSKAAAARIELKRVNSLDFLNATDKREDFDCIYLDPMFPDHKSGAKPAKEMQILQKLTGNLDIDDCFEKALERALKRVVVKRPAKSPTISSRKPDIIYREKTIRFDVYLTA